MLNDPDKMSPTRCTLLSRALSAPLRLGNVDEALAQTHGRKTDPPPRLPRRVDALDPSISTDEAGTRARTSWTPRSRLPTTTGRAVPP